MGINNWDSGNINEDVVPPERRKILFSKPFEETMIGKHTLDNEKFNTSVVSKRSLFSRISSPSSLRMSSNIHVTIKLLHDESTIEKEFNKNAMGMDIFSYVCECCEIDESSYFGLRYYEVINKNKENGKYRYWLDFHKPLSKQFNSKNIKLSLRVRFYPADISTIKQEVTRYMIFSQLRRDLLHGRLYAPSQILTKLGGLIVQSALGDYRKGKFEPGYLSQYKIILKQTEIIEQKIEEEHKRNEGLSPEESERLFLEIASKLETYGYDPFAVNEEERGVKIFVGASHKGILQFFDTQNYSVIKWNDIEKVDFCSKLLKITVASHYTNSLSFLEKEITNSKNKSDSMILNKKMRKKHNLKENEHGFECPNEKFAKHLWKNILALQNFFTAEKAEDIKMVFSSPKIPFFLRGSTFKFPVNKTLYQLKNEKGDYKHMDTTFDRPLLERQKPREQNDYVTKILKKYTENPHLLSKKLMFCSSKNCDKCNDRRVMQRRKMLEKEEDDRRKIEVAEQEAEENAANLHAYDCTYYDDDLITHVSSSVNDVNEKIEHIILKNENKGNMSKETDQERMKEKLVAVLNSDINKSSGPVKNKTEEKNDNLLEEEHLLDELNVEETIRNLNKKLVKTKPLESINQIVKETNQMKEINNRNISQKKQQLNEIFDKYEEKKYIKKDCIKENKGFPFKQTLKAFMSFMLMIIIIFIIIVTLYEIKTIRTFVLKSVPFTEFFENDYYQSMKSSVLNTYNKILRLH
uniref:FERM domain-containing protein n=1 Tax=Parastrongyloides trichosuri TaxID=131310 RepID=A0A0N4ZFM1_PARTI